MNNFDDFSLDNYREQYEKLEQIEELDQLGLDYESELQYAKAEKLYQQAAELAESIQDLSLIIRERYSLAEMQGIQGKYTEALKTYIWLIGIANDPAQSSKLKENDLWYVAHGFERLLTAGSFLLDLKAVNLEEVIDQGLDWLVRIGKPDWSAALRLQRALLWQSQGRYEAALAEMEAAIAQKRRNIDAPGISLGSYVFFFGDLLREMGKLAESKQYYQEVTSGDHIPDDDVSDYEISAAWSGLAEIALQEGDLAEAEICADKSLELAQIIESLMPLTYTYELLTRIYHQQGEVARSIETAIQTWRYVRQSSQENLLLNSYGNIAKIRIAQGKQENPQYYIHKAKQWLERSHPLALRLDRQVGLSENQDTIRWMEAECAAILAVNFEIQGNKEQAEQQYHQVLALDSDNASSIYSDLGYTYYQQENDQAAIIACKRAIELDPQFAEPQNNLGLVYEKQGKLDKAIASYQRAIELNPQFADPHNNLGTVYYDQGKLENAIASYERAIQLDPKTPYPYNNLGNVYYDWGQLEEAIASYERAIELDPQFASAIANRGETYLILKRYKEAFAEFNHAIEINSDSDWYLYDRTLAYLALNQKDKARASIVNAIELAQKSYEKDPKNWHNTFNLALYHLASGEEERAERLYREALFSGASKERIQEAIRDIDHFLMVFPEHSKAQSMGKLLKAGRNN